MERQTLIQILDMVNLNALNGKTVLITGATGLIGQLIVKTLVYFNDNYNGSVSIVANVRDINKSKAVFKGIYSPFLSFFLSDCKNINQYPEEVDYIIHTASNTSSKSFSTTPVEIIQSNINNMTAVLELGQRNKCKKVVLLSTMEIYGTPTDDLPINEDSPSSLDITSYRSCYPESKRLCETMCASYYKEYNLPFNTIRLTQTIGAGIDYEDGRIFAELARCVVENKNIVLATKGETKRNYLYTGDAVSAILLVLLRGIPGNAYNASNPSTYCSIYDMAQMVLTEFGNNIQIVTNNKGIDKLGFAPRLNMNLNSDKLIKLGWKPTYGLKDMYKELIDYMYLIRKNN